MGAARPAFRAFAARFAAAAGRSTEFIEIRDRVGEATAVAPKRIPSSFGSLEGVLTTRTMSDSACRTRWRSIGSALLARTLTSTGKWTDDSRSSGISGTVAAGSRKRLPRWDFVQPGSLQLYVEHKSDEGF